MTVVSAIFIMLRSNLLFHLDEIRIVKSFDGWNGFGNRKVKAKYPGNGWGVALILKPSQIDEDIGVPTLFLTQEQLEAIQEAMEKSDELTYRLLGRGWFHGKRPYFKLADLM